MGGLGGGGGGEKGSTVAVTWIYRNTSTMQILAVSSNVTRVSWGEEGGIWMPSGRLKNPLGYKQVGSRDGATAM